MTPFHHLAHRVSRGIRVLEAVIGCLIALAVLCGVPSLIRYLIDLVQINGTANYLKMSDFLRHAMLLIVGIELIVIIITHSHKALLTLVLFVIARKLLVYAESMIDIFIGCASIAVIFLVFHYLAGNEKLLASVENIFSAAMPLYKLKVEYGIDLDPSSESETLGGLTYKLVRASAQNVAVNVVVERGEYSLKVVEAKDGVIQSVRIERPFM